MSAAADPHRATRQRLVHARRLHATVQGCLGRARGERRLEIAEKLGFLAWWAHAGSFALPAVETVLRVDPDLVGAGGPARDAAQVRGRTLHVATEIYPVGGHTRLIKSWIGRLADEGHSVVLVRQRAGADAAWVIPPGSDAPLIDLEKSGVGRRTDKVARLIELFREARRVVLHIHPDDACSVAAAYRAGVADVRFLNHADHVAWLGAGLPATFLNLRQRGTRLAVSRRGIAAGACDVVPLPIAPPPRVDRNAAREQLGIGARETLLLTIASGYKFTAVDGRSLAPVLERLLARPGFKLLAIGPEPGHPLFSALQERYPGRVFTPGPIVDPSLHRAAADIYLDSYPFCSPTSLLESAAFGTPVVAFQPDPAELEMMYSECPWLPDGEYTAGDPERLVALVDALARDPARREEVSARLLAGMTGHFPDAWRRSMQAHLARDCRQTRWPSGRMKAQAGRLDLVLAGLGLDAKQLAQDPANLCVDVWGARLLRLKIMAGRL